MERVEPVHGRHGGPLREHHPRWGRRRREGQAGHKVTTGGRGGLVAQSRRERNGALSQGLLP